MTAATRKFIPSRHMIPLLATVLVAAVLYVAAGFSYDRFFSGTVLINFISGKSAVLGLVALGSTFVILSGGIDLSVGSMVGCVSIVVAALIEKKHVPPVPAILLVLFAGALFGAMQGYLIHAFALTPFLITLGGLFILRGAGLLVSTDSISITHPMYETLSSIGLPLGGRLFVPLGALIFVAVTLILVFISLYTRVGRDVYAVGGSEPSAILMGLPVGRAKILAYALSGFCAALGGVVATINQSSGNAISANGMELDAIAAVVVGGTLLTGGVGFIAGTPMGVLVFAIIQTAINFDGRVSSWWTKIVIGGLLLAFIVLQRIIQPRKV
jgi:ribose/xylose/arabinose/galactoside ABC-type transport system permease subunit